MSHDLKQWPVHISRQTIAVLLICLPLTQTSVTLFETHKEYQKLMYRHIKGVHNFQFQTLQAAAIMHSLAEIFTLNAWFF